MCHTWKITDTLKTAFHLGKWVTLTKMGHTSESWSHLEKVAVLERISHT